MKKLGLFFVLLFSVSLSAQENIEVLYQNENYRFTGNSDVLEFIDANMDVSSEIKIAEYKLTMNKQGKKNLSDVFIDFYNKALQTGANAFTIEDIQVEDNQYIVTVSLYNLNNEKMQENFSYYEENIVVIFGDLNTKKVDKPKKYKVNKDKVEIMPYTYAKYQNEIGEKIKVSIGGLMGASVTITGEPNKLARCFSLGGTTVMPMGGAIGISNYGAGAGVGVSISTGSIYPMDTSFGLFLMTILDNQQGS